MWLFNSVHLYTVQKISLEYFHKKKINTRNNKLNHRSSRNRDIKIFFCDLQDSLKIRDNWEICYNGPEILKFLQWITPLLWTVLHFTVTPLESAPMLCQDKKNWKNVVVLVGSVGRDWLIDVYVLARWIIQYYKYYM